MSVAVYTLLGELLRDRDMTAPDLERNIARQHDSCACHNRGGYCLRLSSDNGGRG